MLYNCLLLSAYRLRFKDHGPEFGGDSRFRKAICCSRQYTADTNSGGKWIKQTLSSNPLPPAEAGHLAYLTGAFHSRLLMIRV
jgi:hypothetical protein